MRFKLTAVVPLVLVLGTAGVGGFSLWRSYSQAKGLGPSPDNLELEAKLGYHLLAPTWVPPGSHYGEFGTRHGQLRILTSVEDDTDTGVFIIAQEQARVNEERDKYNRNFVEAKSVKKVNVGGHPAGFSTGGIGERRLAWFQDGMFIIISSSRLSDEDLIRVAEGLK